MRPLSSLYVGYLLSFTLAACGRADKEPATAEGSDRPARPQVQPSPADDGGHTHDEVPLGTVTIGTDAVELAQAHGELVAGGEAHLVVKLPYSDSGSTVVRAWVGTEDRTLSYVGKGEYASSHDDYDVHATAPDPLPDGCRWWVEIEKPDGSKQVGSAQPLRK